MVDNETLEYVAATFKPWPKDVDQLSKKVTGGYGIEFFEEHEIHWDFGGAFALGKTPAQALEEAIDFFYGWLCIKLGKFTD